MKNPPNTLFWLLVLCLRGTLLIPADIVVAQGWHHDFPTVGTFSSPRAADLTGDGILDIVLGSGREEFIACDTAVFALDGNTGDLLWRVNASDQIFGSAVFHDINSDSIPDVFIGGRSAELIAIDGASGEIIWRFTTVHNLKNPSKEGWYNFYNPQFIPDEDGDNLPDLLISNGGDVLVEPYDPVRPPGHLVLISSSTGRVLSRAEMPDGKETYMSPVLFSKNDELQVVYGTGGETIGGSLWTCTLNEVRAGDLSGSTRLEMSESKGFIGPPVLADINQDGQTDIIANAVEGKLVAFDGDSFEKLYETVVPNTESYSCPAVGLFTEDNVPDFFLSYAQGVWPRLDWSMQKMVDGKNGNVLFTDSLGFYQNTSPLALDLDGDGRDEVLLSVNFQEIDVIYRKFFRNMIVTIDFKTNEVEKLTEIFDGNNISSTPWVGDLDLDGMLDIIYCHGTNNRQTYTFDGLRIHRIETKLPVPPRISWGAYQGNQYDSYFRTDK